MSVQANGPMLFFLAPADFSPHDPARRWSCASEEELAAGLDWLKKKIDAGEAAAWLDEREALRKQVGQTTSVVFTRA